jgi:hypothetical protein
VDHGFSPTSAVSSLIFPKKIIFGHRYAKTGRFRPVFAVTGAFSGLWIPRGDVV